LRRIQFTAYHLVGAVAYHTPFSRRRKRDAAATRARIPFYRQFVRGGDLVFDVGANVGDRAAIFARLGARVVAVEPMGSLARRLRLRFALTRRVRIVRAAVGAEVGTAQLAVCDAAPTINTLSTAFQTQSRFAGDYRWDRTETVRVTTLDHLIRRYGVPAFCKIDVEGFEASVLAGLSRAIPYVSFEFTREFLDQALLCVGRLTALGYARYNVALGEDARLLLPDWVSGQEVFVRLTERMTPDLWGDIYARE
jgi:FkbM family methyltransferase